APAAPAGVELTPGYFQITAVPRLAVYDPTVQFEFWFSEAKIADAAQVETSARYLGTGSQWSVSGPHIKPGKDFWFYVRSVNLVGKSAFVEASGRASNDAAGYLELFREKIGKTHLAEALWAEIDNSQLKDEMAEMQTTITETRNEITQTVSKTLEDQSATIQQIQRVQTDTRNDLNSMWAVKLQQMQDGRRYIAGIGAGIENTPDGMQSQILLAADRVAFINPENGDTTPALVTQGGQTFINEALIKVLTAPTITSGGNPPAFSLTPDGRLTARNADISGNISASSGTLNNVTIAEDCTINGTMSADRIIGDIVKGYTVDMGQGVMTQNQLTFQKMILLKDNMPFDRKLMLMAYSFSRGEFIMKINDKVVVHARSGKVKTGEREVQISKNASRYEPVYSDVGGSASGSWGIPAGQGDARVEITFRYEAGVLFYRGGSILHDTSQIRIPDPVLFYLKSYTDDFDTAS
ncbi:DUF1983 domain-containing protein, partial [Escherichia coli]|nr:DUF1983 domain-containing protein [Escherichia coli]